MVAGPQVMVGTGCSMRAASNSSTVKPTGDVIGSIPEMCRLHGERPFPLRHLEPGVIDDELHVGCALAAGPMSSGDP